MRQAVVEFVVGGVLPEVRKLRLLQSVELVKELEVQFSLFGDCGVIGVERKLGKKRRGQGQGAQPEGMNSSRRGIG